MKYYFTWHDIEDNFEENRCSWPETWIDVQVYSDSVEIYQNRDKPQKSDMQYLKDIFGRNYSMEKNTLLIDFTETSLDIIFQFDDSPKAEKKYAPLFRDIYFQKCESTDTDFDDLKMIAFHSYKGGVGRTLSLTAFLRQCTQKYPDKKIKMVANLPYYITTPIIMNVLENHIPVESITVMIQKEVAYRMKAQPSTKDYGSLSLAVQYYCEPYLVANVPQNCFMPRPNVDSAVIKLTVMDKPKVQVNNEKFMFEFIKAAFSQRRKTLVNCIFSSGLLTLSKDEIGKMLNGLGYDERVRGESLTLEDYGKITDEAEKYIK